MGLEPTTSAVTGRRSNQLNYQAINLSPHEVFSLPSGDFIIILQMTGNVKQNTKKSTIFGTMHKSDIVICTLMNALYRSVQAIFAVFRK